MTNIFNVSAHFITTDPYERHKQGDTMDYEYQNQHFSIEIAEALIKKRHGTRVPLTYVAKKVLTIHMESGGLEPPEGEINLDMVKQALQNLSFVAKASEISKDVWRYVKSDQWIFGTGKDWVYLYYFPEEKEKAEDEGESVFPCKIGKVDGVDRKGKIKYDAPEKRVEALIRGAREFAKIPLLLRTDSHTTLETVIHKHLDLQRKSISNRPSKEWFLTSPSEVIDIVEMIDSGLLSPVRSLHRIEMGG